MSSCLAKVTIDEQSIGCELTYKVLPNNAKSGDIKEVHINDYMQ